MPGKKVELDVEDKPQELAARAPVVTIMGHVDHGKQPVDVIRNRMWLPGAGGITQISGHTRFLPSPPTQG